MSAFRVADATTRGCDSAPLSCHGMAVLASLIYTTDGSYMKHKNPFLRAAPVRPICILELSFAVLLDVDAQRRATGGPGVKPRRTQCSNKR
jgi:hypothetical protein